MSQGDSHRVPPPLEKPIMSESIGYSTFATPLIAAGRPPPYSAVGIPINRPSRESVLRRLSEALLRQSLTKVCCFMLPFLVSRYVTVLLKIEFWLSSLCSRYAYDPGLISSVLYPYLFCFRLNCILHASLRVLPVVVSNLIRYIQY
jgi:hypothetical protein